MDQRRADGSRNTLTLLYLHATIQFGMPTEMRAER